MADENNAFRVRCEWCGKQQLPKELHYVVSDDLLVCLDKADCATRERVASSHRLPVRHLPRLVKEAS